MEFEGCYYMTFKLENGSGTELLRDLAAETEANGVDLDALIGATEAPVFEKYDEYLPAELVKKGFAHGVLGITEMKERIRLWTQRI